MKKILLSFFTVLLSCSAWAYDKYIDGIYYNLNQNKKEATVTYMYLSHPSAYSGDVVIPSTITYSDVAYRVTSIGSEAFSNSSDLTSIEIPNSVINIGTYAFRSCTGLTSIEIPNSVTNIGNEAFTGCTGLTSIEIPNSVTKIGNSAFAGCIGLTSILVSNGNTIYDSRDNCNAIIESATNKLISGCTNT
ncbi:MAG: leucine-rich repeat domain-containing protein, partial [Bacteroidaceae bacterium]|nr:leucine-rich repeat domain-containing protein [Bacteroidaceae bacterium]